MEIRKDVLGYEGLYVVSSLGRSSMTLVAQGKRSHHKGWVARYA